MKPWGVQYVHCVMHECIMVNVGRKRNTRKVCKNTSTLRNQRGKFCKSRGKRKISRNRGKWIETGK